MRVESLNLVFGNRGTAAGGGKSGLQLAYRSAIWEVTSVRKSPPRKTPRGCGTACAVNLPARDHSVTKTQPRKNHFWRKSA
jgi:hypothetical protein